MKHYYAVIDTNVLVSAALKWESVPGNVVNLVFAGVIVLCLSDAILSEYREVLSRPKFHFPLQVIDDILKGVKAHSITLEAKHCDMIFPDENDRVFYEVTMAKRDQEKAYLVTGNLKHFPKRDYVVSPRQMLDIVLSGENEE